LCDDVITCCALIPSGTRKAKNEECGRTDKELMIFVMTQVPLMDKNKANVRKVNMKHLREEEIFLKLVW